LSPPLQQPLLCPWSHLLLPAAAVANTALSNSMSDLNTVMNGLNDLLPTDYDAQSATEASGGLCLVMTRCLLADAGAAGVPFGSWRLRGGGGGGGGALVMRAMPAWRAAAPAPGG
jgi:hypothetical protein